MTTDRTSDAEPLALKSNEGLGAWRPIATAPRDGLLVLLCTDGGIVFVGKLNKHLQLWVDDQGRERFRTVRYWMPLPPAPSSGWLCWKCGTDRTKAGCPKGHSAALTGDCPMVAVAHSA